MILAHQAQDVDRAALVAGLPVDEHRGTFAGVETAWLQGGQGPPLLLLPAPGETSVWWMRTFPALVEGYTVLAVDPPGHGESGPAPEPLTDERVFAWLDALIEATCRERPVLVGHVLGGAIGARYAAARPQALAGLVLVDTLGLRRFRPAPRFAFGLVRYILRPNEKTYGRFLESCMYDQQALRAGMGEAWPPFEAYNLRCARSEKTKRAMKLFMQRYGVPKIPDEELARIEAPVALIWGEGDLATPVQVAEAASRRFGWPLRVVPNARDDPKLERPDAFVAALKAVLPRAPRVVVATA